MAGGKGRRVKTFKALLPVNSQSEVLYINKEDVVLLGKGDGVPVDVGSGHTSSVLIIPGNRYFRSRGKVKITGVICPWIQRGVRGNFIVQYANMICGGEEDQMKIAGSPF